MPLIGSVVAFDVGTGKTGVAATDAARTMAFALAVVPRQGVKKDVINLRRFIDERNATLLVVGLPDAGGRMERLARQMGDALAEATGLPVVYVDEGYTSAEARVRIEEAGLRRDSVDAHAAAIILEQWLAAQRLESATALVGQTSPQGDT